MRRILCAWLPHWPITRLTRSLSSVPNRPLVTVESVLGVRRLVAVGPAGEAQGLRPGQTLTNARAICPALIPVEANSSADATALDALATWCERYTPLAAPAPPDGLWLDITGCGHFFAGEAGLARHLAIRLERSAISYRIAVAETTGAAWALAHTTTDSAPVVLSPSQERVTLNELPIEALRLDPRTVAGLRRLGLRRVKELLRIPRSELTARFGPMPVLRLDQTLGAAEDVIAWPRPPVSWLERLAFSEPIGAPEDLARAIIGLTQRLGARLIAQDKGGRLFAARFFRVDGSAPGISVATTLLIREPAYLAKLLIEKLETVDPGFGVEVITLEAEKVGYMQAQQVRLADFGCGEIAGRLGGVVDRLVNRLGPERVWRVAPFASHVPERATQRLPPLPTAASPSWVADPAAPRPIRLLHRPEPIETTAPVPDDPPLVFRWRGALHRVRAAAGPERISAEWWRRNPTKYRPETDLIRDYYRVEDTEGAQFWLFRTGLHCNGRTPRWYLHGLFA